MHGPVLPDATIRSVVFGRVKEVEQLAASCDREEHAVIGGVQAHRTRSEWSRAMSDAILDLSERLPAGTEDYEVRQLLYFHEALRRAIEDDPTDADPRGDVALAAMKMVDVAARLARRLQHSLLEIPDNAAAFVFRELDVLTARELAELLGVSSKTIGAWKAGSPVRSHPDRVVLVARLVAYLRSSMTPRGVLMWFKDQHDPLDGERPIALLKTANRRSTTALVQLARGGRGQLAD